MGEDVFDGMCSNVLLVSEWHPPATGYLTYVCGALEGSPKRGYTRMKEAFSYNESEDRTGD